MQLSHNKGLLLLLKQQLMLKELYSYQVSNTYCVHKSVLGLVVDILQKRVWQKGGSEESHRSVLSGQMSDEYCRECCSKNLELEIAIDWESLKRSGAT